METKEKFCPVCKNKNKREAVFCKSCGALLEYHPWDSAATTQNTEALEKGSKLADSPIDETLIPEGGIAIYAAGASNPIYLRFDKELILGRKSESVSVDSLLDLTGLGGYQMGLSRRHAMIRRAGTGYELIDLSSTNGSWLNDEKLIPNKSYPLKSGAQLRIGRMRLLIVYHPASKAKKARQSN
ncbi:MAG TPA: FHA domain-containing protein [Anaerolineales bacterium]|nr:FHA domain-containing protein [Anaerolineales bacterium]